MFLENSKRVALQELRIADKQIFGSRETARLVGIGYATAKGWATYAGNGVFKITDEGLAALREIEAEMATE